MPQTLVHLVWSGVVWSGVVWCGLVWCGLVWCVLVWSAVVWLAPARGTSACGTPRRGVWGGGRGEGGWGCPGRPPTRAGANFVMHPVPLCRGAALARELSHSRPRRRKKDAFATFRRDASKHASLRAATTLGVTEPTLFPN